MLFRSMAQTETTVITGNAPHEDVLGAILLGPVWDDPFLIKSEYDDEAVKRIIAHPKYNELREKYNTLEKLYCRVIDGDATVTQQAYDEALNAFKAMAGVMGRRGNNNDVNNIYSNLAYNIITRTNTPYTDEEWVDNIVKYRGSANRKSVNYLESLEDYPNSVVNYRYFKFNGNKIPEMIFWRNSVNSKRDNTFVISNEYKQDPVNAFVNSFNKAKEMSAHLDKLHTNIYIKSAFKRLAGVINQLAVETALLTPYIIKRNSPRPILAKNVAFSPAGLDQYMELLMRGDRGNSIEYNRVIDEAIAEYDKDRYDYAKRSLSSAAETTNTALHQSPGDVYYQNPTDITPYTDPRPYPVIMPREHRGLPDYDKYFGTNHWDNDLKVVFYYLNGGQNLTSEIVGATEYARLNAIGLQNSNALASAKPIFADAIELWRDYHQAVANNQADVAKTKYKLLIAKVDELIVATGNPTMPATDGKVLSFSVFLKPYYTPEESLDKANAEPWSSSRWSKYFTFQFDDKAGLNRRVMFAGTADGLN